MRQATRALGEGVHVHVAKHVVGLALQDLLPRAEGSPFTYASAFSGLDGFAAALHEHLAGSPMHYAFAAERDDRLRGVLCHTWEGEGLVPGCLREREAAPTPPPAAGVALQLHALVQAILRVEPALDSPGAGGGVGRPAQRPALRPHAQARQGGPQEPHHGGCDPVSYTHLTLPTN